MKLFDIYELWTGSANDFKVPFQQNEALFNQANQYWNGLEKSSIFLVCIFVGLALFLSIFYFIPYNNQPGRHYKPLHWAMFGLITFISTFILTLAFTYIAFNPQLSGAGALITKIALGNSLYGLILYLLISIIWWSWLPTNAYRVIKL